MKKVRCHLVSCGPTLAAFARERALRNGCVIITYHEDGRQEVEYPPAFKKQEQRRDVHDKR